MEDLSSNWAIYQILQKKKPKRFFSKEKPKFLIFLGAQLSFLRFLFEVEKCNLGKLKKIKYILPNNVIMFFQKSSFPFLILIFDNNGEQIVVVPHKKILGGNFSSIFQVLTSFFFLGHLRP